MVVPQEGLLACGEYGTGKLAEVDEIADATLWALAAAKGRPLAGRKVLITAGPTREAIDPVRYIANASSGKMGYALARAARNAGAEVVLVSGPTGLACPVGVERVEVVSAAQMHAACEEAFSSCDAAILAAAVADYTPAAPADHKLKKTEERLDTLELAETADILAGLSASARPQQVVLGFAAETDELLAHARAKLERKGCDLIVANDVSRAESTFGSDTNLVTLVEKDDARELPLGTKDEVAAAIIAELADLLEAKA